MSTIHTASLCLAERTVPRYTSYPTAPHFTPAVDATRAESWIAALAPDTRLSLYLHVPFCAAICTYCGCNTKAVRKAEPLDAYAETLMAEIDLVGAMSPARQVAHIHWGGGTPSLLGPDRMREIVGRLRKYFDFTGCEEHAIELDPRSVSAELVAALAEIGVTRASLGVQDLSPHVQAAIGRIQPYETVERSVSLLRAAGIAAINFDLMYGLPEQTEADVERTARLAAQLDPSRLAIFGYAHVPWFKTHQRLIDESALPGAAARLAQAAAATHVLEAAGYVTIGLDHFARPDDSLAVAAREGRMHRNFQGYTTDECVALLPLGASSIGRLPQGFVQNAPDVANWRRAVEAGHLATVKGIELTGDDCARGEVIERLMCDMAVDYGTIALRTTGDASAFDDATDTLDDLARDGILVRTGRRIELTREGRPFMRLAAAAFDAFLVRQTARHSVAV